MSARAQRCAALLHLNAVQGLRGPAPDLSDDLRELDTCHRSGGLVDEGAQRDQECLHAIVGLHHVTQRVEQVLPVRRLGQLGARRDRALLDLARRGRDDRAQELFVLDEPSALFARQAEVHGGDGEGIPELVPETRADVSDGSEMRLHVQRLRQARDLCLRGASVERRQDEHRQLLVHEGKAQAGERPGGVRGGDDLGRALVDHDHGRVAPRRRAHVGDARRHVCGPIEQHDPCDPNGVAPRAGSSIFASDAFTVRSTTSFANMSATTSCCPASISADESRSPRETGGTETPICDVSLPCGSVSRGSLRVPMLFLAPGP